MPNVTIRDQRHSELTTFDNVEVMSAFCFEHKPEVIMIKIDGLRMWNMERGDHAEIAYPTKRNVMQLKMEILIT